MQCCLQLKRRETRNVNVKGGKFLESIADADTIVFDKTGTLTKAEPTVVKVVSFNGDSEDELLRTGCMFGGTFSSFYGKGCC